MYVLSNYQLELKSLKEIACNTCRGTGTCNNNDGYGVNVGDWICESCKGTGYSANATLTEKENDYGADIDEYDW